MSKHNSPQPTNGEEDMPHADQLTGYAKALKEQRLYPLKKRVPWNKRQPDKRRPVATPFLVIPNFPGDDGAHRPLDNQHAVASGAIDIIDSLEHSVTTPGIGHTYVLRCNVIN